MALGEGQLFSSPSKQRFGGRPAIIAESQTALKLSLNRPDQHLPLISPGPGCVCVGCLFLRTPSRVPCGTPSACANRAAYPDPPPEVPDPESIDTQTAYRGRHSTIAWVAPAAGTCPLLFSFPQRAQHCTATRSCSNKHHDSNLRLQICRDVMPHLPTLVVPWNMPLIY